MRALATVFFVAICAVLAGCESPESTVSTARRQLADFQAKPDNERQAAVERTLSKLDGQVAELEKKGDAVRADLFRRQALSLKSDFQAAKMARALTEAKNAIQGFGEAIKDAGKSFSETLSNAAKGTNAP
jgi:predicted small secreted protein